MTAWLALWPVLAVVAVLNGALRAATYGRRLSEPAAHRLSTLTCAGLVTLVVLGFERQVPLESPGEAWLVGFAWLVMTVGFEFMFGLLVAGHSLARLLHDYNLRAGRWWPLFLAWLTCLPALVYRVSGAG